MKLNTFYSTLKFFFIFNFTTPFLFLHRNFDGKFLLYLFCFNTIRRKSRKTLDVRTLLSTDINFTTQNSLQNWIQFYGSPSNSPHCFVVSLSHNPELKWAATKWQQNWNIMAAIAATFMFFNSALTCCS